ncbi:MAG: ArnT family glycosyltransferase, partial [Planctomycetota bacterium]
MLRKSEETGREEGQATRTRPLLLCLFFLLGVRLATLTILPLVDSTETRYAQIAVEMNRSGDAVTPQIWRDGELVPYLGKPPLSFWLTSATMATFGANPF